MPANGLKVNTTLLAEASKQIKSEAGKFQETHKSVFGQFAKIDAAWDGDDNAEFNTRVTSFKKDFEAMDDFFLKLQSVLDNAKEKYETAERETLAASRKLAK